MRTAISIYRWCRRGAQGCGRRKGCGRQQRRACSHTLGMYGKSFVVIPLIVPRNGKEEVLLTIRTPHCSAHILPVRRCRRLGLAAVSLITIPSRVSARRCRYRYPSWSYRCFTIKRICICRSAKSYTDRGDPWVKTIVWLGEITGDHRRNQRERITKTKQIRAQGRTCSPYRRRCTHRQKQHCQHAQPESGRALRRHHCCVERNAQNLLQPSCVL